MFWRSCWDITRTRTRWTKTTGLHWPSLLEFCPSRLRVLWHGTTTSLFKVCSLLLEAQAEVGMNCRAHPFSKSISDGASVEIQNLLSLHSQFQCLGRRCHIHELSLSLIVGFQFVTAVFVVSAKSRLCADEQRSVESWRKRTPTRWDSQHARKRSPRASHDHKQIALVTKRIRGSGSASAVFETVSKRNQMRMRWGMLLLATDFDPM